MNILKKSRGTKFQARKLIWSLNTQNFFSDIQYLILNAESVITRNFTMKFLIIEKSFKRFWRGLGERIFCFDLLDIKRKLKQKQILHTQHFISKMSCERIVKNTTITITISLTIMTIWQSSCCSALLPLPSL